MTQVQNDKNGSNLMAAHTAQTAQATGAAGIPAGGKRILIIDDDDGIRDIVAISLEALAGWQVFKADSGAAGIALARSLQPDAILLDVMMPDQDGMATLKQLQSQAETCAIATIFLTAKARKSEQQRLLDLGCAGLITKPFEVHRLVPQICQLLAWRLPQGH
jgi:DNA-binding response OmpR family regulator